MPVPASHFIARLDTGAELLARVIEAIAALYTETVGMMNAILRADDRPYESPKAVVVAIGSLRASQHRAADRYASREQAAAGQSPPR